MKNTLTQLFWPRSCLKKEGYIIGWPIHGFICCVISVSATPYNTLNQTLAELGEKAEILGIVGKETEAVDAKSTSDLWISAEVFNESLILTELYCCGYKYKANAHIIFFEDIFPPSDPVNLLYPNVFHRKIMNYSTKLKKPELSTFQLVSEKINRSHFVSIRINKQLNFSVQDYKSTKFEVPFITFAILLMKTLSECAYFIYLYEWPGCKISIKSLPFRSQFVQQLISRESLLRTWDNNRKQPLPVFGGPYLSRLHADSILRTNSALFTIVCDFMLGLVLLLLLCYFSADALVLVHTLGSTIHIEVLKSEVNWLMGLPAGFKPNEALDNAVGTNILRLIDYWNLVTTYLTSFEIEIVQFFAVFGLFGISFQLALLSDLIDFCTLHM